MKSEKKSAAISFEKLTLLIGDIVQQPAQKFITKSCRRTSFEFIEDGFSVIHKYSRGHYTNTYQRIFVLMI